MELRLIVDSPRDGASNMSLDEALLESAAQGIATLRFYFWSEPTLSVGYFQALDDRRSHAASTTLPVVRRTTGGGAIVHDAELTYSFTTPSAALRSTAESRRLYDLLHRSAVQVLRRFGVPAQLWDAYATGQARSGPSGTPTDSAAEPFLCFRRRTSGDVVAEDIKVLGSAQRRARQALLQHGSLILATSRAAPEIAGLERWLCSPIDPLEVVDCWSRQVGIELATVLRPSQISEQEQRRAELIRAAKFTKSSWTERR